MTLLAKPPVSAKQFLIINLYDLKLTPRLVSDSITGSLAHLFVRLFNHRLHLAIERIKHHHPQLVIKEFDNYHFFKRLAADPFFRSSLGQQCDGHNMQSMYYQQTKTSDNCFIDSNHGYLYWSNSHPSSLAHALLATALTHTLNVNNV